MTEPASVGTVSVEPVPERAAPRAEAAPTIRRPARAGRVSGAPIDLEAWPTRAFLALADVLGRYHRHQVVHLERLRRLLRSDRPVLLVGNHALDIVDPPLLATICRTLHRRVWDDCQRFLDRVVANRGRCTDALDRSIRGAERLLERITL
jgi:hypothetical protein